MIVDATRYMPCAQGIQWKESLFDVKTVLPRNEVDDGRPIMLHRHPEMPNLLSVLGGKIDNIYDLFEILPSMDEKWSNLKPHWIFQR